MISINPADIKCFGDKRDMHFCLVTNSHLSDKINLINDGQYLTYSKVLINSIVNASVDELKNSFTHILKDKIPKNAHVLVIAPDNYFRAPTSQAIGPARKVIILPCNSTPTDLKTISDFWESITCTDPELQEEKANHFFQLAEKAEYLEFIDEKNKTSAIFKHMHDDYVWNEQGGFLNYSGQQLAPAGEISVCNLPVQEFDENLRLDFNGTLSFHGYPIVHSGTLSFSYADQKRIYDLLANVIEHPIIAYIKNGEIQNLTANTKEGEAACKILQSMFDVDSRYRILLEIGFGINTNSKIIPGNHAMNETFGGSNGVPHFGIGLIPFTQYHVDILCPNLKVITNKGELLMGADDKAMHINRKKVAGCFCIES